MRWEKLGRIFCPSGEKAWMQSHAAVPFAENLEDNCYRIYFTTRDSKNRSHVAYVDMDILNPSKVLGVCRSPVLSPGPLGAFDDSGAMGSWLVRRGEVRYLYYQGWNLGVTVPFRNSIGLAISEGVSDFSRYCPGPILDRTMFEPHFTATPCVIFDRQKWRMWYLSCTEWFLSNNVPKHKYHIKYAESVDGINWERQGIVAIDYKDESEYAIARPSVIKTGSDWEMWFSCRGNKYRIGYARSIDGVHWERNDSDSGIDVSTEGWDSEMIEYPFVFDHKGQRYLLYNGNGYGKTGFGLAVLAYG
jgi:hypothetical protein